jgi:hypothetical protein
MTTENETNAGEMIGRYAVAVFKRRCEQHPKFMEEPAIVMQMMFDELFNEAQKRGSYADKTKKGRTV